MAEFPKLEGLGQGMDSEPHMTDGMSNAILNLQENLDNYMQTVIVQKVKSQLTGVLERICHESFPFTKYVEVSGLLQFTVDDAQEVTEISICQKVLSVPHYPNKPLPDEAEVPDGILSQNTEIELVKESSEHADEPNELIAESSKLNQEPSQLVESSSPLVGELSEEKEVKPDVIKLRLSLRDKSSTTSEPSPPKRKRGRPKKTVTDIEIDTKDTASARKHKRNKIEKETTTTEEPKRIVLKLQANKRGRRRRNRQDYDTSAEEKNIQSSKTEKSANENEEDAVDSDEATLQIDTSIKPSEHDPLQCNKCDFVAESEEPLREHRVEVHGALRCSHCPHVEDKRSKLNAHIECFHDNLPVSCDDCNERLPNSKALKEHIKSVHCNKWRCAHCDLPHPTKELLQAHVRESHADHLDKPLLTCDKCEVMYIDGEELQKHVKEKHTYSCDCCDANFPNASRLATHRLKEHPEKALECGLCSRKLPTRSALVKHIMRHKEKQSGGYSCDICHKTFTAKSTLYHHKRGIHEKTKYRCDVCGKTFNFHHSLKLHSYKHTGRRPYPCDQCSKAYLTASHLKDHVEAVHSGERKFKCEICDKTFPYENSLRMHSLLHTDERPFCCEICGKMFVSKSALKVHEELHSDETYKCQVCDKVYRTKGLLRAHQRRHTRDGHRYMCDICGNTFMYESTLQAHKAVHGSERAYKCNICNAEFKTNATLYSHRLVHTNENPFSCNTCGKAFKTKERMKAHERRHVGDKPFSCNLCGSSFPDRGGLSKHNKTVHATTPRFKCPVCGKLANRADNLRVHMKVHNDPKLLKMTQEELMVKDTGLFEAPEPKVPPLPKRGSRGRAMLQYLPDTLPPKPGAVLKAPALKTEQQQQQMASKPLFEVGGAKIGRVTTLVPTAFDTLNSVVQQTQPADLSTHTQEQGQVQHQSQGQPGQGQLSQGQTGQPQGHLTILAPTATNASVDVLQSLNMVPASNGGTDMMPHLLSLQSVNHPLTSHVAPPAGSDSYNTQLVQSQVQPGTQVGAPSLSTGNVLDVNTALNSTNVLNGATVLNTTIGPDGQIRAVINPLLTLADVMSNAQVQDNSMSRVVQPDALNFTTLHQYVPYSTPEQISQPVQYTFQS